MVRFAFVCILVFVSAFANGQNTRQLLLGMKGKSDTAKMRLYTELANTFIKEEPDSAILFYSVAMDYAQRADVKDKQVFYLRTIADLHRLKGSNETAISFYNKTIDLAGQLSSSVSYLAEAYQGKGMSFNELSRHQEASGAFFTSLNLYEHLGDSSRIADLMDLVGTSMLSRGDHGQAMQYYRRSLEVRQLSKDELGRAKSMIRFGDIHMLQGALDSAYTAYKDAFNIALLMKDSLVAQQGLIGMATIQLEKEKWDQAYSTLVQAKDIARARGARSDLLSVRLLLGRVHYKRKELNKAIEELQSVYIEAATIGNHNIAVEAAGLMSWVHYDNGNFQKSADLLRLHNAHLDTVNSASPKEKKDDAQVTYEHDSQQRHEEIAQQAMELQQANERQVITIWWIVGLSLLGASTTILFLVIINRRRRRINRLLKHSLRRREHLLKEFHYRVKNNLQLVYSLLNLQKSGIRDKQAAFALGEAQNRIRSMGLVHEHLYIGTQLGHVDFQQYLVSLLDNLKHEYLDDNFEVDIEVHAEDIAMSSDKAIPVGLIINELASNAFKFAYSQDIRGKLDVALHKSGNKEFSLIVRDNGPGMGDDFSMESVQTLGLELVQILALQLGGEVSYSYDNGAVFKILITGSETPDSE